MALCFPRLQVLHDATVLVLLREWSIGRMRCVGLAWTCVKVGTTCHCAKGFVGFWGLSRWGRMIDAGPEKIVEWEGCTHELCQGLR